MKNNGVTRELLAMIVSRIYKDVERDREGKIGRRTGGSL